MKYKISEISKMSGFSPSGIRFFEEAGLISPIRGSNQKYREFSLNELQLILACKRLREFGYSLQEAVEFLSMDANSEVIASFHYQMAKIEQEITRKKLLTSILAQKAACLERMESVGLCCEIRQMPALYRVNLWQPGSQEGEYHPFSLVHEWLDKSPFTESCLKLSGESLLLGEGDLETKWGLSIEEETAKKINFQPTFTFESIPVTNCVCTIVQINENLTISSSQLARVREFFTEKSLKICGPAYSRYIIGRKKGSEFIRFDHLWVPVNLG